MIEYDYPGAITRYYPGTRIPITFQQRFTPTDISGVVLWLDGKDSGTVIRDASNKVRQWNDKSGLGNHAVQNTDVNKPTYIDSIGHLSFDGATTFMLVASNISHNITEPMTIFCAARDFGGPAGGLRLFLAKANHGSGYAAGAFDRAGRFSTLGVHDYTTSDTTFWRTTKTLCTFLFDLDANVSFYQNNVLNELVFPGLVGATNPSNANLCIGAHVGDGTFHWQGELQEIILINRALSEGELARINTYAIAKWGIV
jgi:hypothetical protein